MSVPHNRQNKMAELHNSTRNLSMRHKKSQHTSYTRAHRLTNVSFAQKETELLSKGLQYSLHFKHKTWIETSVLEAETAVSEVNITDQEYTKQLVNRT
jgi:hypothetical protein